MQKVADQLKNKEKNINRLCGRKRVKLLKEKRNRVFHSKVFLFNQNCGKNIYRLELIFVLISFTVSAKAESFFICFSTLSMECSTVE